MEWGLGVNGKGREVLNVKTIDSDSLKKKKKGRKRERKKETQVDGFTDTYVS